MNILLYLLIPVLAVAVFALATWFRNRQPSSLESGVDAFRREMSALSPDAAPLHRRRPQGERERDADRGREGPRPGGPRPPAGRPD